MTKSDRANFGSKLGVILASAGSAVGLGNIWRFPFETGNHGGAAFIFVYLVCVLILGIPIMIAEFLIGRRSRANTARAYQKLAPGTHWRWVGRMGVLAGFLILGYYSVVAGWTLEFIGEAATNSFAGKSAADFIASFNSFVSNPWRPVIWLVLFLLATHLIIVKGVEKGIEKSAKIMMPMLFVLLIILAICSISLPGWMARNILRYRSKGGKFHKAEDFRKIYGMTEKQYQTLLPYIHITPEDTETRTVQLYSSPASNDSAVTFRIAPEKYPSGTLVDLNRADTTELKKIPGIGSGIARLIIGYRQRLGGFYNITQLQEIHLDTTQLQSWFSIDTRAIHLINLNRSSIERLRHHPYINFYQAKAFVEYRKKKGDLHSLKPFALYEEFSDTDLEKISHYVCFE